MRESDAGRRKAPRARPRKEFGTAPPKEVLREATSRWKDMAARQRAGEAGWRVDGGWIWDEPSIYFEKLI